MAQTLAPISLNISMACTKLYGCGNWNSTTKAPIKPVVVSQSWKKVPVTSPCYGRDDPGFMIPASAYQTWSTIFLICYSDSPTDGIKFSVPFDNPLATLSFEIRGSRNVYASEYNDMYMKLDVNPEQWKTAFLSQTKIVDVDGAVN